jgi:hypothetical protein
VLRTREQVFAFHREIGRVASDRPLRARRPRARLYFRVRDGKIVFFDQIGE